MVDPDDAFTLRAAEFTDWARTNIRLIVGGAVLIAVLVGGLLYYRVYREDRLARAATEFVRLQQTAASGNAALATRDLDRFVARYDGTAYADEARIALAQLHLQQDQPARAVEVLGAADAEVGDAALGAPVALMLAAAQQAAGQADAAIATYLRVADGAELKMHRAEALQTAAVLRTEAGDLDGAAELYRRLVDSFEEGSFERQLYGMRLAEVEASAAGR